MKKTSIYEKLQEEINLLKQEVRDLKTQCSLLEREKRGAEYLVQVLLKKIVY